MSSLRSAAPRSAASSSASSSGGTAPSLAGLRFNTSMDYAVPGMGTVTATSPDGTEVGHITFGNGKVHGIHVEPGHRRKGIGTALYSHASKAAGPLTHSANRTDDGEAFARKAGGRIPRRSPWRPTRP